MPHDQRPHQKNRSQPQHSSKWSASEISGKLTAWMGFELQASSSIGKTLRHVPNSCQLHRGRDVANTHTHSHMHTNFVLFPDNTSGKSIKFVCIQTLYRLQDEAIRKTALARQLVPLCSRNRCFVPMQSQWHTQRPKVFSRLHRMQLEMKTTSGLHMLYKFVLQSLRVCLTSSLSYRVLETVLHNLA